MGLQKQRKIPQKEGATLMSSITSENQVGHSCNWDLYLSHTMEQLKLMQKNFKAGQLKNFVKNWSSIASDAQNLKTIEGVATEFTNRPYQRKTPFPIKLKTDIISN